MKNKKIKKFEKDIAEVLHVINQHKNKKVPTDNGKCLDQVWDLLVKQDMFGVTLSNSSHT